MLIWATRRHCPPLAAILEWLPAGTAAQVWLEVAHAERPAGARPPPTPPSPGSCGTRARRPRCEAVRAAELPEGTPYAWIAGESGTVKALRRHLVRERELDRHRVTFVGYWRRGVSEDGLREEAETAPARSDD